MNALINYFFGKCQYECSEEDTADILNSLIENGIEFYNQKSNGENVRFCIHKRSEKAAAVYLTNCTKISESGFFQAVNGCIRRPGLIFGGIFCIACIFFSSLFLWDIEVLNGDEEYVLSLLEQSGLKTGAFIPHINEDIIEIKALLNTDEYSYISININGTLAQIETEKRVGDETPKESRAPSNLVASSDGRIVRFEVYSGDGLCKVGQTVEKGELLISGIDETKHHGSKIVRARGAVYAVVEKEFTVSYPFSVLEKTYTGRSNETAVISICGINAKAGSPSDYALYDTDTSRQKLTLFNFVQLPIYITSVTEKEYEYKQRTLTEKQAQYQAKLLYYNALSEAVKNCEVLSRSVTYSKTEKEVFITCKLSVITDIAQEVKIHLK